LKTPVTIQLDLDFPYTLKAEDFTVTAIGTKDKTYVRFLNVLDVDDAKKTIRCMFGGAWTGQF